MEGLTMWADLDEDAGQPFIAGYDRLHVRSSRYHRVYPQEPRLRTRPHRVERPERLAPLPFSQRESHYTTILFSTTFASLVSTENP